VLSLVITLSLFCHNGGWLLHTRILSCGGYAFFQVHKILGMDLPNLRLWSGLRIGPQMMDGLSAGRSPPRRKRKGKERKHDQL